MKTAPSCSCAHCRGAVTKPRVSTTCEPIGRGCMAPLGLRVRNCAHCRCWQNLPWTGTEWTLESAVRLCPPCGCQSGACPIATSIPCLSGCRWSCRGSSRSGSLQPHSSIPLWVGLSQRPQRSFRQRTPASQGNRMQPRWRQKSRVRPPKKDRQFRGPSVSQKGSWPAYTTTQYVTLYLWFTTCAISSLHDPVIPISLHRPYQHRVIIGIDHDTACAGVGGTAIRHSTSCAGRRAAACGWHNECCAWWQYHPWQRRPYKWSISILPRSQFYKKQGKFVFSTSCTAVRPHRRLRNDAWRRDS